MFLKLSIHAVFSTIARIIIALSRHHSIETSLSAVIGHVVVLDTCILLGFRSAETRLHLIIFGSFSFPIEVDVLLEGSELFQTIAEVVQPSLVVLEHTDNLSE